MSESDLRFISELDYVLSKKGRAVFFAGLIAMDYKFGPKRIEYLKWLTEKTGKPLSLLLANDRDTYGVVPFWNESKLNSLAEVSQTLTRAYLRILSFVLVGQKLNDPLEIPKRDLATQAGTADQDDYRGFNQTVQDAVCLDGTQPNQITIIGGCREACPHFNSADPAYPCPLKELVDRVNT